jgi:regulator of PEP synthase PpsR (kinase-PPPase family)
MNSFHIHLVSDSTGETVILVARASLVQFNEIDPQEHHWTMIRSPNQVEGVLKGISENPGFVIFTLVNIQNRKILEEGCRRLQLPCIAVLDPVVAGLGTYLGAEIHARPGGQHVLDDDYFNRIEAMQFALSHDDGQSTWDINEADVVLLGVSRTTKTPTSFYLANRGIKTANIPIVPGCPIPTEIFLASHPLIVCLTQDPKRLVEIRRQRLRMIDQDENTDYVDLEMVTKEINDARRLCGKYNWAMLNISRKSIEETAATVLKMCSERQEILL